MRRIRPIRAGWTIIRDAQVREKQLKQLAATPATDDLRKQVAKQWSRMEDRLQMASGISKRELENLNNLLG